MKGCSRWGGTNLTDSTTSDNYNQGTKEKRKITGRKEGGEGKIFLPWDKIEMQPTVGGLGLGEETRETGWGEKKSPFTN